MSDLIRREDAINAVRKCVIQDVGDWAMLVDKAEAILALNALPSAEAEWILVSERLPSKEDCPMDCLVTRKSNFIGNYVDMAVAEANGTWTHEDWDAIVLGDVESGRKTGLISTRDDEIIAWMPLPTPYKGGEEE